MKKIILILCALLSVTSCTKKEEIKKEEVTPTPTITTSSISKDLDNCIIINQVTKDIIAVVAVALFDKEDDTTVSFDSLNDVLISDYLQIDLNMVNEPFRNMPFSYVNKRADYQFYTMKADKKDALALQEKLKTMTLIGYVTTEKGSVATVEITIDDVIYNDSSLKPSEEAKYVDLKTINYQEINDEYVYTHPEYKEVVFSLPKDISKKVKVMYHPKQHDIEINYVGTMNLENGVKKEGLQPIALYTINQGILSASSNAYSMFFSSYPIKEYESGLRISSSIILDTFLEDDELEEWNQLFEKNEKQQLVNFK